MTSFPSLPLRRRRGFATWTYLVALVGLGIAAYVALVFYQNIMERKTEGKKDVFRVVEVSDATVDPAIWGKNYPRQYDSYKRTVDTERTNHGGSEAYQHLDEDPVWRRLFAGYAFGIDYREERGHAYMLSDQRETDRTTKVNQPGACLQCHASTFDLYIKEGLKAGAPAGKENWEAQTQKGFEVVCKMPYSEATKLVEHPVSCTDCHEADTMALRVNRPGFLNGIRALARSDYPTPHLPSIERWRKDGRKDQYEPNVLATRQEMRSLVCAQCHVEYYFKGEGKLVTYPWDKGLKAEQIEAYYDEVKHVDFNNKESGAPILKAQHPEFELWSQGIHARSGVSCADCHMPYVREGAIKVSNHHVRSPLLNVAQSCQTCHRVSEKEITARALLVQDRNVALLNRGEQATIGLVDAIVAAQKSGATDDQLKAARDLHRKAQWRLDFISAENSMGFHAPQEAARILAEAIDYARQGELAVARDTKPATRAP